MNTQMAQINHEQLEHKIAQRYRDKGYEVLTEPKYNDIPFDLGSYQPDLVVKKSDNEGYIIEIKKFANQVSVDRYREIAEMVVQHSGWRFLLVTGDDTLSESNEINGETLISWTQIVKRRKTIEYLITQKDHEDAFLLLWVILEALIRKKAEEVTIPIERFPTLSLIKHIYSQGELSIEQYNQALNLLKIRNQLIHGFQIMEIEQPISQLKKLVDELIKLWIPKTFSFG